MPVATSTPAAPRPSTFVKMEERKRPAVTNPDDLAPPSKRQHLNGSSKSRDDAGDSKEEAWIEEYQKDAALRQMYEYKRENATLVSRLEESEKRSTYHDDHIRIIDAWVLQLLQEIELVCEGTIPTQPDTTEYPFPSALQFKESREFQRHLGEKTKSVKSRVELLFKHLSSSRGEIKPELSELESQIKTLLASQKEYIVRLDRLNTEKENLSEQLDSATYRYIKAEKKLDRVKSLQVQKLEQQALANATSRPTASAKENGVDSDETNAQLQAIQLQYQESTVEAAKLKEQLESAHSEIKGLTEENSTFKARRESLTDEDYSRTEVFKQFKTQNEDLIKRINHLEATNKQLQEDAEKYQSERTAFRTKLESEAQSVTGELEDQVQLKDQDLTRIRSARDELLADNQVRKACQDEERSAREHLKELISAQEDRIAALELEIGRLRPNQDSMVSASREHLEPLSKDELIEKLLKLEKDFASIQNEVPSVEKALRKAIGLANKKVMDFTALEERSTVLVLEKGKADQKYFAARKDMDIKLGEIRTLRHQNSKSSEIIASLKEADAQSRTLMSNLEKQLADLRQSNILLLDENKELKGSSGEAVRRADGARAQITDLTNLVKTKDAGNAALREHAASRELESEKFRVRLTTMQKDRDSWKNKCLANSSEEEEMLRNFATCTVCRNNFKNAIIKTCGHVFCQGCLETRLSNRMRKCPTCNKAFDKMDVMAAHL